MIVTLSFMLVRHTKFAPDHLFGLIKRKYHSYSINDMIQSSAVAGRNTVQLAKNVNGNGKLCGEIGGHS